MKKRFIPVLMAMTICVLRAGEHPTVDLFAGWGWSPFPYYASPAPYGGYPVWRPWPYAGVLVPFDGRHEESPFFPYGYDGYAPFWGYEYGVRLRLLGDRQYPALSDGLLPTPPGSAPLELRDPQLEKLWDQEIRGFLGTSGADWLKTAQTNTPHQTSLPSES